MKSYYLIMILLAVTSLISYLIVRHIVYKTADDVAYLPDVDLNQVKMRLRVLMISVVSKVLFGIGEAAILFFFRKTRPELLVEFREPVAEQLRVAAQDAAREGQRHCGRGGIQCGEPYAGGKHKHRAFPVAVHIHTGRRAQLREAAA